VYPPTEVMVSVSVIDDPQGGVVVGGVIVEVGVTGVIWKVCVTGVGAA
jgi:hypothetical protein